MTMVLPRNFKSPVDAEFFVVRRQYWCGAGVELVKRGGVLGLC